MIRHRRRRGVMLLEVGMAAVIMAVTFITFMRLVDDASNRVVAANVHQVNAHVAQNLTARFGRAPLDNLERALPPDGNGRRVAQNDPLLPYMQPYAPGAGSVSLTMKFRRESETAGRFQVEVVTPGTDPDEKAVIDTKVTGRKPPAPRPASIRLAKSYSPAPEAMRDFLRSFEGPDHPIGRRVLPILELESRHGDFPEDLIGPITGATTEAEVVSGMEGFYAREHVPDGRYVTDWVDLKALPSTGGAEAEDRFHLLEDASGGPAGRLVVRREPGDDGRRVFIQRAPSRALDSVPIVSAPGPAGPVAVPPGTRVEVVATDDRLFLFAPRFDSDGQPSPDETEVTLVTLAPALGPGTAPPEAAALAARLPSMIELAGYSLP